MSSYTYIYNSQLVRSDHMNIARTKLTWRRMHSISIISPMNRPRSPVLWALRCLPSATQRPAL
jgi:hypothetical protein